MKKLFVFLIFAITYGSLFPFTFSTVGDAERWQFLFSSFNPFTSLGDILGNIALFIPYGLIGVDCFAPRRSGKPPYLKLISYGLFLALILQFIQVYFPPRSPAFADVYWNGLGILLGIVFMGQIKRYFPKLSMSNGATIESALALIWLLYLFFPFVPSLDFQAIKDSVKPLFLDPAFHGDDFLIATTGWMIFTYFSRDVFQNGWVNKFRLPLFALCSVPIRAIVLENYIDVADIAAIAAAIILWPLLSRRNVNLPKALAGLVILSLLTYGLSTPEFSLRQMNFSWVAFSGFLEGSLFTNTRALFFKLFLFSSLIWLVRTGWPNAKLRLLWIFLFILAIEVIQVFMVSRTAEITDPLLILVIGFLIRPRKSNMSEKRADSINTPKTEDNNKAAIPVQNIAQADLIPDKPTSSLRAYYPPIIGGILITVVMATVIKLPGVPYNVRELFRLEGNVIAIIPFTLFILWFGISIPLISRKMLRQPDYHIIRFPLWVIGAVFISYLLLKVSVTDESIADIAGSSNVYWFVTNQNIWGDMGTMLSRLIPSAIIWNQIEEIVRFTALISPLTFMLCLFYHAGHVIRRYEITNLSSQLPLVSLSLILNTLYALPWFYLCKVIAFDHSSTDNLNELIARDGVYGLGGGGYLYMLVALLSLNAVWVAQKQRHSIVKLLSIIIGGIGGWFLFKLGMESEVHKYNQVFSGVDFLLGPDRQTKLSQGVLFLRWIILYSGAIALLSWGMMAKYPSLSTLKSITKRRRTSV